MRDRGVSTMLSYVLGLGIAALLVSGLFIGMSGVVDDQRERAVRSELEVVGNRIASDIAIADQMARNVESGTVRLTATVPDRAAGVRYSVEIQAGASPGEYRLRLRTEDPDVTVSVSVRTQVPVETGTVRGGHLTVAYDDDQHRLEVTDA